MDKALILIGMHSLGWFVLSCFLTMVFGNNRRSMTLKTAMVMGLFSSAFHYLVQIYTGVCQ